MSQRDARIQSHKPEEEGLLNRLFRRERPPVSHQRAEDEVRLYPTPAIEYAFRSIARNPSRYRQALAELYLAEPDDRPHRVMAWFLQGFRAAWADVRTQYPGLRDRLPHPLSSEEDFLLAVGRRWGDLLFGWAAQLYHRSGSFRSAVEQAYHHQGETRPPRVPPSDVAT